MAQLFSTAYPNNIRNVIAGDFVSTKVFPDDVVLNCNTLTALVPFSIDLLEIPSNYWSTQYKLYICDTGNNASVRNITINAPVGQTINNASSVTINTNGGCVLIRIIDNLTYIATYNAFGSSGGYNLIKDEGIALPQRTTINFVGSGVVASDVAGETQVNVNGGLISLTNAQMLTLISTNAVIPSQFYLITDAELTDGGLVVQGIETNNLTSLQGSGLFFDADYQGIGNYSGVTGYVSWKNIWTYTSAPAIVAGDVVIWNNLHYVSITGVYYDGVNPPDVDTINWQVLPKTATNGYIRAVDFVKYDVQSNLLLYRADKRLNEVDRFLDRAFTNSIKIFQWGRDKVTKNKLRGSSIMKAVNSYPTFEGNILDNSTIIDITGNYEGMGIISFNTLTSQSLINSQRCLGNILSNEINSNSKINFELLAHYSEIKFNFLSSFSQISITSISASVSILSNTLIGYSSVAGTVQIRNCQFNNNYFSGNGILNFDTIDNIDILDCEVSDLTANLGTPTTSKTGNKVRKGYSNWQADLDFTDVSIWNGTDLIIPTNYNYIGIFTTNNANILAPVFKILNMPTNHNCTFTPIDTQQCAFQHTLVGVSVADDLLCDAPASLNIITGRADGTDFIEYKRSGTKNIRTNLVLLA